jgi:hypothetical protein
MVFGQNLPIFESVKDNNVVVGRFLALIMSILTDELVARVWEVRSVNKISKLSTKRSQRVFWHRANYVNVGAYLISVYESLTDYTISIQTD